MSKFVDAKGREWVLDPTWPELEAIYQNKGIDPLGESHRPMAAAILLLEFTKKQRAPLKVDESDFLSAVNGDDETAEAASAALTEAIGRFFKARTA